MRTKYYKGILPEHKDEAAQMFAKAFGEKFEKLFRSKDALFDILIVGFNDKYAITAISEEKELQGIVGFSLNGNSLTNISLKKLIKKFGFFLGLYKKIVLSIIFYKGLDSKKQLLMDGIVVHENHRGKKIGTGLIEELVKIAHEKKLNSIKLDVIDGNPAIKLYEELGFVKKTYVKNVKFIAWLIRVKGLTTMVKAIS